MKGDIDIRKLKNEILSVLFPTVCGICGNINKEGICGKCMNILKKSAKCEIIDINTAQNFEKLIYVFKYEGLIRKLILDYKFNEK